MRLISWNDRSLRTRLMTTFVVVVALSSVVGVFAVLQLGRVNATRRVTVFGIIPIGALLGGYLGSRFGLHSALVVSALVHVVGLVVLAASPLRSAGGVS